MQPQPGAVSGGKEQPAAKALELIGALKGLLGGPSAQPYVLHVEQLEAEIAKFATPVDMDTSAVAFEDLDADDQVELDGLLVGSPGNDDGAESGDGSKQRRRAALLEFSRKMQAKRTKRVRRKA